MPTSTLLDFNEANNAAAIVAGYDFTPTDGSKIVFGGGVMLLNPAAGATSETVLCPDVAITAEVYGLEFEVVESAGYYHQFLVSFDGGSTYKRWGTAGWRLVAAADLFNYGMGVDELKEIAEWPDGAATIMLAIGITRDPGGGDGSIGNINYLNEAAGSAAIDVPGEPNVTGNIVANGDFPADLTGWTTQGAAAWSALHGGSAELDGVGGNAAGIAQEIATVPGFSYLCSIETFGLIVGDKTIGIVLGGPDATATEGDVGPGSYITFETNGFHIFSLQAGAGQWLRVYGNFFNLTPLYIDNISVNGAILAPIVTDDPADKSLGLMPDFPLNKQVIREVHAAEYVGGYDTAFNKLSKHRLVYDCVWSGRTDAEYQLLRAFLRAHRTEAFYWKPQGEDDYHIFVAYNPRYNFKNPAVRTVNATLVEVFP